MLSDVQLTVLDNQLGVIQANIDGYRVLVGVCSAGVPNRLYQHGTVTAMTAALGTGPLPEALAYEALIAGAPMISVPVNPSVAGVNGAVWLSGLGATRATPSALVVPYSGSGGSVTSAVTHTGTGTSVMTVSGTPTDNYSVRVKVLSGGARGAFTFQYSLDGGVSWSGSIVSAATYVIKKAGVSTGLTLAFSAVGATDGVVGDLYDFTSAVHGPTTAGIVGYTGTPAASTERPSGAYDIIVKITLTGARGTATFQYSLNGGLSFNGQDLLTAATYIVTDTQSPEGASGLTLTFDNASTFTSGDRYRFWADAESGSGCGTVTVSGAPLDAYQAQVRIITGAVNLAAATGVFQYSLDQGNTWSPQYAIPSGGVFVIAGTGLTLTFVNGDGNSSTYPSFVADDLYELETLAPGFTTGDLNTALAAAFAGLAGSTKFSLVHVVGVPSGAAATVSLASTVSSALATAVQAKQWVRAIIEAADDTDADLQNAFATFVDARVSVAAGFERLTSPITKRISKRPCAWTYVARLASVAVSEDAGMVARGPLQQVQALLRDERVTPGLDAARFTTLRTYPNLTGFYITSPQMMEVPGGDFELMQFGRVMDKACVEAYASLVLQLRRAVRVNKSNVRLPLVPGGIDPRDAANIEKQVVFALSVALLTPGDVTAVRFTLDRSINIISAKRLSGEIGIVPLGYVEEITSTIGFENPAFVQV